MAKKPLIINFFGKAVNVPLVIPDEVVEETIRTTQDRR
jgi:hypothetical protein